MDLEILRRLKENIAKVMIGKERTTELLLTSLLARGHVLLEDVPGTGKTVLAKSLAKSLEGKFGRVQFTPDLLPSDVTGLNYYDAGKGKFIFQEGPVFCSILLADEINRATPKTQSSLLECMAENQVTIDGVTRKLETVFFVVATQNPVENLGTFPLPEAQMDRFLMRISMEEMTKSQELAMAERFMRQEPLAGLGSVCTKEEIAALQKQCQEIYIHGDLLDYMIEIVRATRRHEKAEYGVSPRGTLAFIRAAQGFAMVGGRDYVIPEDIKSIAVPVLSHRIGLAAAAGRTKGEEALIEEILNTVPVPTEEWKKH